MSKRHKTGTNSHYKPLHVEPVATYKHKSLSNKTRAMQVDTKDSKEGVASDAAEEVGSGLRVTKPPRHVPHCYNNNYTVRLTYADNYRHLINYGAGASQIWRSNSLFDPDYTGTGHQPLMRDLWASMYDYYAILQCDYEITLYNGGTDTITWTAGGSQNQRIGSAQVTFLRSTNTADFFNPTAIYPAAEMKNTSTYFLPPEGTVTIKGSVTPGDFIVDAKDADSDTTWTAQGANPAVPQYIGYMLSAANYSSFVGQSATPFSAIQAYAKLDYTVQFTQVNQSLRALPS